MAEAPPYRGGDATAEWWFCWRVLRDDEQMRLMRVGV